MTAKAFQTRPKILCIDDDPAITQAIRLRLESYEVDVLTAADGTDGMWMAINQQPDVIITDLRMPNGDGDYVVECLKGRSDTDQIPIITLTGRAGNETKCWMQTLGVKHHLCKPLQIDKMLSALDEYIELRSARHHAIA